MELFVWENKEYTILIGKDKASNWKLIDDAKETDIWFHASNFPSAHIILKTDEVSIRKIPRQVITRCACICKSKSSKKSDKKCEIIYTTMNNVSKTTIVGQVVPCNTKSICV
uniref:NFACT RNA-binding domain-containing protein n=1 Tax=viral metagenome TaxID=1070528 RepID=A0A6C0E726_9ZZZZ